MITFSKRLPKSHQAVIVLLTVDQLSQPPEIYQKIIKEISRSGSFQAKDGELFPCIIDKTLLLLAGLGKRKDLSLTKRRIRVKKALESSFLQKCERVAILPDTDDPMPIVAFIEGATIGHYQWNKYKTDSNKAVPWQKRKITILTSRKSLYQQACSICDGVNYARDLVNDNADHVTARYFFQKTKTLVKGHPRVKMEVLNQKKLRDKGLNLHLAVNQGSRQEPLLIIAKYTGNPKDNKYTAVIGKGITFDTGGLNLKPTSSIESMRQDMAGAAAVLGVLKNALALQPKKNVVFAMALAENAIGSVSYKPGDVIKGYAGKTVEIGNTDAEGRLVLADAIAYVIKNYPVREVIDIATLTGACIVALGHDYSGLMSNHPSLAQKLLSSAKETDDWAWQLPNYPELKEALRSSIADIKNLGFPKGVAGTLTAGEFLRQFVGDTPWAHLDIAGTGFINNAKRMYYNEGATGAGVRLLTHFINKRQ
jgi:leucyl aminopeptidase